MKRKTTKKTPATHLSLTLDLEALRTLTPSTRKQVNGGRSKCYGKSGMG